MSKKRLLTRFNLQPELLALIEEQSHNQNITKHDYLNQLLYEKLVKKDNRLSQHIVRDVENLLLVQLTTQQTFSSIKEAIDAAIQIDPIKRNILMERREVKRGQFKSFWNQILKEINPDQFLEIKTKEAALEKLKTIFRIVFENKEVFA
ncbi:MAG: hypothetical protein PHO27_07235 [Sulfuricurvum sp.]|nr:hypothetical protein [Sulfuricurvum sp.]